MADTLYETLGVPRTASVEQIRARYRKLARKHHPDVNPGDAAAEDTFKKVAAAYEVLADPQRRAAYDEFGDEALQAGFDPAAAREYARARAARRARPRGYGPAGAGFDVGDFFDRGPSSGQDVHATVPMDLRQAIQGTEVAIEVPGQGTVRVRIPPGADTGSTIRIAGKGAAGRRGGPPGDLVIETMVEPHPQLRRNQLDLTLTVPVTLDEAYSGAQIEVPTFDGPVLVKVPPRSQPGTRLRLRGKGIRRKDERGDFYVELEVRMPDLENAELAAALASSSRSYSRPVRDELKL